ncbi:MAG TPA: nitrophenyl compound nitroreductase subunit ArsF family protein [Draconibacterium sp.]|nr:nitrophenyl compound nitroreductase subunit ArsF family protein [Draconibacterium sp.]
MKTVLFIMLALFVSVSAQTYGATTQKSDSAKKEILYFHNTRKCATCKAIEAETKKVLNENFSTEVNKGEIVFSEYNAEDKSNKEMVKELGVTGTSLIIVEGDKKTDLTSKGFMYAVKQPEKLRKAIIKALEE